MAHSSALTSPSENDMYLSGIITGAHGDKYQKDLALVIFERATRKGHDFKLGYEMAVADKFDDVAFFDKSKNEWTLIQTKHADTSKGKPSPLKFEMLFPKDESMREKGDFSLYKYLKSYLSVKANIKERTSVVIFTNKDLVEFTEQLITVEPRQVDEILLFEHAKHLGLTVREPLIKDLIDYVNSDFNSLRNSIIKLCKEGVVDDVIKKFKTPVASIFTKTETSMSFSENPPPEAAQMLESLSSEIDIRSAMISTDKCKDLYTGKSRNKTWPICANQDIVHEFFNDLTLFVAQPDDLRDIIHQDFRLWMRTWIRPHYFMRLEESQFNISSTQLENFFDNEQSQGKTVKNGESYKTFLQLTDGKNFLENVSGDIDKQIRNMSNYNIDDWKEYYISRRIQYAELSDEMPNKDVHVKRRIRDEDFVNELYGVFKSQKLILLIAEPGMGKSIILEFIAMDAQQKTHDCIYLFHLNTFNRKLEQINQDDRFEEILSIFEAVLSKTNLNILLKTINCDDNKSKNLIILDALDEVLPAQREKILKIIKQMLQVANMKVIVSARKTIKTMVENYFGVKAMRLVPFDEQDQINFLKKFWKVPKEEENKFHKYVAYLFNIFHLDINNAIRKFVGLPLMLKMLAEVYEDHFTTYLNSIQINLEKMMPQQSFSLVQFYEQFVKKSYTNKLRKKMGNSYQAYEEEYELSFKTFALEHQLLAIKILEINFLENEFKKNNHAEIVNKFEKRIKDGTEKSSLVEAIDNDIKFIHRSYAEFLVANFLFSNIEIYETEIFGTGSEVKFVFDYPLIGIFLFGMIEEQHTSKHFEILERHFKKNNELILLACKMQNLKIVKFLLRTKCDSTIISQLLCVAAEHNCYNICAHLLEKHKAEVDYNITGWTPLQKANDKGFTDIIYLLIDHTVYLKNNDDWVPLRRAIKSGHWEEIKLLIEYSRQVNATESKGWTALHFAALNGNSKVVETLIKNTANIEAKNNMNMTPLHVASEEGHSTVVEMLIENGANIEAKNADNETPLHFAARKGHLEVVEILIKYSADIEAKDHSYITPLHVAAEEGHSEVVKMLIGQSANIDASDNCDRTPLHFAAKKGHLEVVKVLFDKHTNITDVKTNKGWSLLQLVAKNGHSEVVKMVIDNIADIVAKEHKGWTPLHQAAADGDTEAIKILIDNFAYIESKQNEGLTPLHLAAQNGHSEAVKVLTDKHADTNAKQTDDCTPLHLAAGKGHSEVIKILLNVSADINAETNSGWTPLHFAVQNGHSKVVEMLIEKHAPNNTETNRRWTLLLMAARNCHSKVVKILINNIADIVAKENIGWTPLHRAAVEGNLEVAEILIKNNANIEAKNHLSKTPLHVAAEKGHSEVVKTLIDNLADIDAKDNFCRTPLYFAAEKGHFQVVKILIDKHAKIDVKTNKGWTLLQIASQNGCSEVVKMLINYIADVIAKEKKGWTPLHQAAADGDIEAIKILIDNYAEIEAKQSEGLTSLHLAAQNGHSEAVKILIHKHADTNAKQPNDCTSLHLAAEKGHSEVVKILLQESADIKAKTKTGWTPLHFAAQNGHSRVVQILIKKIADINLKLSLAQTTREKIITCYENLFLTESALNAKTNLGWTPVNLAVKNGHTKVIKMLIYNYANIEATQNEGLTPLQLAANNGHSEVVNILNDKHATNKTKKTKEWTLLLLAAQNGHPGVEKMIIDNIADYLVKENKGRTPLHLAVEDGWPEVVELLIKNNANIEAKNQDNWTPLHIAAEKNHSEVVELLIKNNANIDANWNDTPLFVAAASGHSKIVEILIKNNANIEAKNYDNWTPLHCAAKNGHTKVVELLIKNNANIEAKSLSGCTPLYVAVFNGYSKIVELLIKNNANIEAKNLLNWTPLYVAAKNGHSEVVELLIKNNANIDAKDHLNKTPLHYAAEKGHSEVVKVLIKHAANIEAQDNKRLTPLDYAVRNSRGDVVKILTNRLSTLQRILRYIDVI